MRSQLCARIAQSFALLLSKCSSLTSGSINDFVARPANEYTAVGSFVFRIREDAAPASFLPCKTLIRDRCARFSLTCPTNE